MGDASEEHEGDATALAAGFVRTKSGKLIHIGVERALEIAEENRRKGTPPKPTPARRWLAGGLLILALTVLGWLLVRLDPETRASLDSGLGDFGYIVKERRGHGITR